MKFVTTDFGTIEIDRESGDVYFQRDDYCTKLEPDRTFRDRWDREFLVCWPLLPKYPDAILQCMVYREVSRVHHTQA